MPTDLAARIAHALDAATPTLSSLSGGCVADVSLATFPDGRRAVVKSDAGAEPALHIEGLMLRTLAERSGLPVPRVLHDEPSLLIMDYVEADGRRSDEGEREAGRMLAALHDVRSDRYGFERDTLIGGLPQRNTPADSWLDFFRDHRLLHMADQAADAGRLPSNIRARIDALASRLPELLDDGPLHPSLIHGDVWGGNVLWRSGRIAAFIDPAISYSDPEIELAFITLFSCFGPPFFETYQERRPIRPGFFETRRDLLNLFPLLVHVRLFGGGYVARVDAILRSHGC